MTTLIWINTDSGDGLLPDSTKPLPESIFFFISWINIDLPSKMFRGIHMRAISQEMLKNLIHENVFKIMHF